MKKKVFRGGGYLTFIKSFDRTKFSCIDCLYLIHLHKEMQTRDIVVILQIFQVQFFFKTKKKILASAHSPVENEFEEGKAA